jgi:hypothetical protein
MSAPKNTFVQKANQAARINTEPTMNADRLAYGEILKVNSAGQVKVTYLDEQTVDGNLKLMTTSYMTVATPMDTINLLYGNLRPGLRVLVHWKGGMEVTNPKVYVIGEEGFLDNSTQPVAVNIEITTPPFGIFSGGMTDLV